MGSMLTPLDNRPEPAARRAVDEVSPIVVSTTSLRLRTLVAAHLGVPQHTLRMHVAPASLVTLQGGVEIS